MPEIFLTLLFSVLFVSVVTTWVLIWIWPLAKWERVVNFLVDSVGSFVGVIRGLLPKPPQTRPEAEPCLVKVEVEDKS